MRLGFQILLTIIYLIISFGVWFILYNTFLFPNIALKSDPSKNASAYNIFFTFAGLVSSERYRHLDTSNKVALWWNRVGIVGSLIAPFLLSKLIQKLTKKAKESTNINLLREKASDLIKPRAQEESATPTPSEK